MAEQIRFTQMELRAQKIRLARLQKYLPTLELKQALLQTEVDKVNAEIDIERAQLHRMRGEIERYARLFSDVTVRELTQAIVIQEVEKGCENIAGVEVPLFHRVRFVPYPYSLFETPLWMDPAIGDMQEMIIVQQKVYLLEKQRELLIKELRDVSIRVNLFKKNLIPKAQSITEKIRIFLWDLQLSAVAQSKVAKRKSTQRRERRERA
jgi:V/A-type H+-transporting ATPase subunit D